jgi:glycosyltransferase involved in cell wall biosynthesis
MKIAAFLQDLAGGGAERVAVLLLNGLVKDNDVTLILARREGPYLDSIDPRVRIVDLGGKRTFGAIVPLARWLRRNRPDILISHLTHVNVAAAAAVRLSRKCCAHIAVEHNQMDLNYNRITSRAVRLAYRMVHYVYPGADAVVCVSAGVADSVQRHARIGKGNINVIGNPVVTDQLRQLASEIPHHPWLSDGGAPVILGCGRLVEQKDFANLLHAFKIILSRRSARLLILGDGPLRPELEAAVTALGIGEHVSMPGFDSNPFAAMRTAAIFALSSRWEGLPTVLIEALASGAVVVSTDCPSGPRELLQDGALGPLVPVGDPAALAQAIEQAIDHPADANLRRSRAEEYTAENAAKNYLRLFTQLRPPRN